MADSGFFYHPDFLLHDTGPGHPERKERLEAVVRALQEEKWARGRVPLQSNFQRATLEQLGRVHDLTYLEFLAKTQKKDYFALDPDTIGCAKSWDVARLAAGAVIQAAEEVHKGNLKNAFCAVRPPGHHAERERAMGFCLINNVAVAVQHLIEVCNYERILIVDWDAHHGNGTQHIFYSDSKVFYFSLHQYPFYPGTGAASEAGEGAGKGTTLNVPLAAGNGDADFLRAVKDKLIPAAKNFHPQFILISAGFDAHRADPLAELNVSEKGFAEATRIVKKLADEECGGKLVSVLEGGYDLEALAQSVIIHLKILSEE